VPPNSSDVKDTSTEVRTSAGNSHAQKATPFTDVFWELTVKVSLTINPKLMVQASSLPLTGPLSYTVPAEAGRTNPRQIRVSAQKQPSRIFMEDLSENHGNFP